jgi:hypothetical protein
MAKDMKTVQYVSDRGKTFKIWVEASRMADANAAAYTGADDPSVSDPSFPAGSRPRQVQMKSAGGVVRWVTCYTVDAPLYDGSQTELTFSPFAGSGVTGVAFTATGIYRAEKFRNKETDNLA